MEHVVYMSGVFDLFHFGHMESIHKVRALYPNSKLVVGVHSDEDIVSYKRKPVMSMAERVRTIEASRLVDKVIPNAPLLETEAFYLENDIDVTIHAHIPEEHVYYRDAFYPHASERLVAIPYTLDISTSEIIERITHVQPQPTLL